MVATNQCRSDGATRVQCRFVCRTNGIFVISIVTTMGICQVASSP